LTSVDLPPTWGKLKMMRWKGAAARRRLCWVGSLVASTLWRMESGRAARMVAAWDLETGYLVWRAGSESRHVVRTLVQPWWVIREAAKERSPGERGL
jgi:hypothetical protein